MKITPEDREIIKQRFPKFSKIQACMVNNPEYGLSISPEAKDWLNRAYFAKYGMSDNELTEQQAEHVQKYVEGHFGSIKSFIIWTALQHEEPMHEGLSGPVADLPDRV